MNKTVNGVVNEFYSELTWEFSKGNRGQDELHVGRDQNAGWQTRQWYQPKEQSC